MATWKLSRKMLQEARDEAQGESLGARKLIGLIIGAMDNKQIARILRETATSGNWWSEHWSLPEPRCGHVVQSGRKMRPEWMMMRPALREADGPRKGLSPPCSPVNINLTSRPNDADLWAIREGRFHERHTCSSSLSGARSPRPR